MHAQLLRVATIRRSVLSTPPLLVLAILLFLEVLWEHTCDPANFSRVVVAIATAAAFICGALLLIDKTLLW